ncbi:MAG: 5-formyltetrahydrofolate cyclo-ligase [Pseudonocardiaceae bacterium]|nr:5-formyltetrahydrofolate cyclo-ligase [Pseudonocardiaceae bacterium]
MGRVPPVARRHDEDAGGCPELLARKSELREQVWSELRERRQARFPGAYGRIPNFVGAEAAADRLAATDVWRRARTVKCNPDAPQWPVRQRALQDGKVVYMAVPRLAEPAPFFLLDPDDLADPPRQAASIKGASRSARRVRVEELEPVDLVVTGCVAAGLDGARLGKGGGFGDLEFAVATEAGLIGSGTTVVTTVHERQLVAAGSIPTTAHDIRLGLVVTPEQVVACAHDVSEPARIRWDELTEQKVASIPLLGELRDRQLS